MSIPFVYQKVEILEPAAFVAGIGELQITKQYWMREDVSEAIQDAGYGMYLDGTMEFPEGSPVVVAVSWD